MYSFSQAILTIVRRRVLGRSHTGAEDVTAAIVIARLRGEPCLHYKNVLCDALCWNSHVKVSEQFPGREIEILTFLLY